MSFTNPALASFLSSVGEEFLLAEVLLRRAGNGFELRHQADRAVAAESLQTCAVADLRTLAQFTATGAFRPLKSAPNLRCGWRANLRDAAELETALNHLYPGAMADWHAAQATAPPITHYREFTARQTGMYRITQMLTDAQAATVIRACCQRDFCLKRRLWSVDGLAIDSPGEKSAIPCLEPCALLLELARKAMRIEQASPVPVSSEDATALVEILETFASEKPPDTLVREADFNEAVNPRRMALLREKLRALVPTPSSTEPQH